MHASVKCFFFIKEIFALLQFSLKFAKFYISQLYNFAMSEEIELLEFENEVLALVALITNVNFQ